MGTLILVGCLISLYFIALVNGFLLPLSPSPSSSLYVSYKNGDKNNHEENSSKNLARILSYKNHSAKTTVVENHPHPSTRAIRISSPLSILTGFLSPNIGSIALSSSGVIANSATTTTTEIMKTPYDTTIDSYFPGSLKNSEVTDLVANDLIKRNYIPGKTILGYSICATENKCPDIQLIRNLQNKLVLRKNNIFNLGGLASLPIVGRTDFDSFVKYSPYDGKMLVVFGPQVGISKDGDVGLTERNNGTKEVSGSFGMARAAIKTIWQTDPTLSKLDLQKQTIIENLEEKLEGIDLRNADNDTVTFATYKIYRAAWDLLRAQILEEITLQEGFWGVVSEITILGGISIGDDTFQPLLYCTLNQNGINSLYGDVFEKNVQEKKIGCRESRRGAY